MAKACGVRLNLVVCGSRFMGQEKVPSSRRLVSTHKPVPSQHRIFDPSTTPVAKDKQRSLTGVFTQPLRHQPVQAVEALAQVARLHGDKHFQAAGKTQHDWASERNKSAAKAAC